MSLDADLLRTSFALIAERDPSITRRFYDNLFSDYPQVRPLFHESRREAQERMLAEAIGAVLDHLEDAPWLQGTLGTLGTKHVEYGVTAPMYDWVGATLLKTFAEVAGDDWTPQTEAAWADAYGAIAHLMRSGANAGASQSVPTARDI